MNIEAKKVQLEILKMEANIIDAEIRVSEKMAEIDKINDNISKYEERKKELLSKLEEIK